ncbi:nuclear transport factor 2 family protein [Microbacterium sp.]|uniref:nuclear transport factor 2 family protein n=1 Tax=Microbacterium sp. TaxID=51671 RepID=UPI0028A9FA5A|nr:nuclear transport factor 2 family protein [Microbacterium sp.]
MSAEDRVEIAMLIARIAHLADSGTPEEYIACFAEDAVWELADAGGLPMSGGRTEGSAAILAGVRTRRADGIQGPGSHTRHDVSSIVVDVYGDRAESQAYFRYYTGTDANPTIVALGTYDDTYVRDAGGWKLSRRTITRS